MIKVTFCQYEHCARKATCYHRDLVGGYRCDEHDKPQRIMDALMREFMHPNDDKLG